MEELYRFYGIVLSCAGVYVFLMLLHEAGQRGWIMRAVERCRSAVMWFVTLRLVSAIAKAVKYRIVQSLTRGGVQ